MTNGAMVTWTAPLRDCSVEREKRKWYVVAWKRIGKVGLQVSIGGRRQVHGITAALKFAHQLNLLFSSKRAEGWQPIRDLLAHHNLSSFLGNVKHPLFFIQSFGPRTIVFFFVWVSKQRFLSKHWSTIIKGDAPFNEPLLWFGFYNLSLIPF